MDPQFLRFDNVRPVTMRLADLFGDRVKVELFVSPREALQAMLTLPTSEPPPAS